MTKVLPYANELVGHVQKSELLEVNQRRRVKGRFVVKRPNDHGFGAIQFQILVLPFTGSHPLQSGGDDNVHFQSSRGKNTF